jgi:hypothetical protein
MRQDDAPAGLMVALLFEIREPFDTDFGRYGWHKEKKFHSWTVPFGVYTKGSDLRSPYDVSKLTPDEARSF